MRSANRSVMRKKFIIALTTFLSAAIASCAPQPEAAEWTCDRTPLLVTNIRALGDAAPQAIFISGGSVKWTGPVAEAPAPSNIRIIDGAGATVLPGLIDSHTHFDALPAAKHLQADLDPQTEIFPLTMRQTLASGVTTARTHLAALSDMSFMAQIADDACFPAPRIVISGPGLLGGAPDVDARLMRGVAGSEDAKEKVNELSGLGAEWAALHGIDRFTNEELTAIFAAADTAGMKIMADTDSFEGLAAALNWPVISGEYINRSPAESYPPEILEAISGKQEAFFIVPPVGYYYRSHAYAQSDGSLDDALFQFATPQLVEEMRGDFQDDFELDSYIARAIEAFPTYERKFQELTHAGAIIVAGSDSGSLGQFHYDAIWRELDALHVLGAAPQDVMAAATSKPARMLDRPRAGNIETGALGDLVLYKGDINAGEFDRSNVAAVIKGGVVYVHDGEWVGPNTKETTALIEQLQDALP